jgi:hypothetical protein
MTDTTLSLLVVVFAVIAVAPVVSDLLARLVSVPSVVLEIGLGV